MRTASDYEVLRSYAVEGGEAHNGVVTELAVFVACGSAAWMRACRQLRSQVQAKWESPIYGENVNRKVHGNGNSRRMMAVLLANIIESRGGL